MRLADPPRPSGCLAACACAVLLGACAGHAPPTPGVAMTMVRAAAETTIPADAAGEADDPAIWLDRDADRLWVLGTDKATGLFVYDRDGRVVDAARSGKLNNVDVLDGWADDAPLVGASQRSPDESAHEPGDRLVFFRLDPASGSIEALEPGTIDTDLADPYGFTLTRYQGQAYAFVTSGTGALRQYALERTPAGGVTGREVRRLEIGSIAEGIVADPRTGSLYVAEERVAIWRYAIDPDTGDARERVAPTDGRRLFADIEGLALAPRAGWLVASSQGSDHFAVYRLDDHGFVGAFRVIGRERPEIDTVTHTDGIELAEGDVDGYPGGLFVAHDDVNQEEGGQNYKLVPWGSIRDRLSRDGG